MSTPFMILSTVYLLVFGLVTRQAGRGRPLGFRGLLESALWPLDLLWPFLIAGVATLELCAALAQQRFGNRRPKTEAAA